MNTRSLAYGVLRLIAALRGGTAGVRPRVEACSHCRRGRKSSYDLPALAAILSSTLSSVFILTIASLSLIVLSAPAFAVPPGTNIDNTASAAYQVGGSPVAVSSNTLTITSVALRTPSTLELLQYAPASATTATIGPTDYSTTATSGGPFAPLAPWAPVGGGVPVVPPPVVPATQYHIGEPVFIRVTDPDQNIDSLTAETILVTVRIIATGETEVLRLTETGPNTGVFTGYIQSGPGAASSGNGVLNAQADSSITVGYTDAVDGTDTSSASVLVDPYGQVFNSLTGLPVDGVVISIVDSLGNPVTVYGDNGVSIFPSTIVSGGTVMDSGGATYTFPPGGYRFPFIVPGNYQYRITVPANYRAPSAVPTATLQALPGAPFAIVTGSRGEIFIVDPGPAVHIDIPVDPTGNRLYVQKTAGKSAAAIGDFIPYRISVQNVDPLAPVNGVAAQDRMPLGFRYQKGSARVNGVPVPDPAVTPDGRTLSFALGTLAVAGKADVTYVVEAGAGARTGTAVNTAYATGDLGAFSNVATASVQVTEDLFRGKATVVGRLLVDGCGDPLRAEDAAIEGVRIYLEDGTSVVTDKNGIYHFAAVKPGAHVVQIDLDTLPKRYEVLLCDENNRFAGRAWSQFVDVQGGSLWRADFHLAVKPKMRGLAGIQLMSSLPAGEQETVKRGEQQAKNRLEYFATVQVSSVPLRSVRLMVMLPPGVVYLPGSSMLDNAPLADPAVAEDTLTYRLEDAPGDWTGTVWFGTEVKDRAGMDRLTAKAVLLADTPDAPNVRTPVTENTRELKVLEKRTAVPDLVLRPRFASLGAQLSKQDRAALDKLIRKLRPLKIMRLAVIGHTDSVPIRGKGLRKFKDNYALSDARARAVAEYLAKGLKLGPEDIEIVAKGPDEPVAPNETAKGRSQNRRVDLKVYKEFVIAWTELDDTSESSGFRTVETVGLRLGDPWPLPAGGARQEQKDDTDPAAPLLDAAEPGFDLLWPAEGHHPPIPSVKIAVKHDPADKVFVRVNGEDVNPIYYDGTRKSRDNRVAVSLWRGVNLAEGDNRIEVAAFNANGAKVGDLSRSIHYSGPPVSASVVPERSRLIADGRTPPVVAVRLLDKDGHPAREGVIAEYAVDPPELSRRRVDELRQSPLIEPATDRQRFTVGEDGMALIELQPTTRTGDAALRINLAGGMQELRLWLKPEERDWILVGLAEGTAGYNTATGNMEGLSAADAGDKLYSDGRLAFYAKGRIQGKWLLTIAYDSARKGKQDGRGLFQAIDPNQYYTLYGDATWQQSDAPSSRSLYLKIERDQFYALFGDYATGLTVTELSRYNRAFTGLKSELKSEKLDVTVFASDTDQAFVKDEIRGDGTSGLYRLSRKSIVLNSERVAIEARDRFRSEVIVSTSRLSRWLDYTIDYENGTIFFKEPVPSRDGNFNPVFIVVEYESFDPSDTSWTYGGRAAVRPLGSRLEVGATHVHEGMAGGGGDLTGVDAAVRLGGQTKARVEAAATRTETGSTSTEGSAYLAQIEHRSERVEGRAYVREQEAGFGLGQQNGSETGTRKLGFDAAYRVDGINSVRGEAFRQENLNTGAVRDMAELQWKSAGREYEVMTGFRYAEDAFVNGQVSTSEQVFLGAKYRFSDRATIGVSRDQSLSGKNANADFPTRTTLGAEYRLSEAATFFAAQEFTEGALADTATTRLGLRAAPWNGSALSSTVEEQYTESGTRLFATTGLKQTWRLTRQWTVDAGLDRSATIRQTNAAPFNVNVPPASGGEDFTAVALGAAYKEQRWSWTGRIETRRAASEDKVGLLMGANGEPRPGLGLAGGILAFRSETAGGNERTSADIRLGLAYRPKESVWIALDRLDYIIEDRKDADFRFENWRIVNNLALNYRMAPRTQVSVQYGAKYVSETIEDADYSGYTDLIGLEGRYDVTKSWDVGVRGSLLHSWNADQMDYGAGVSVGYAMAANLWISVGYNITGFRDRDFSAADFTAEGPFLKLRMKFDQASVRDALKWFSGQ